MEQQFYTILTKVGKAKIANSNVLNTKLNLTKFQVGDGGGAYYNPTEDQIQLKNKVWQGNINSIRLDKDNPSWIVIEVVIPSNEGGFMIREAGIVDDEGNLIAVGKYPETFKPNIDNGSSKDLFIRMILEISNAQNVTLKVDPTVIMATKKDIKVIESSLKSINDRIMKIEVDTFNKIKDIERNFYNTTTYSYSTEAILTKLNDCTGGFIQMSEFDGITLINLFNGANVGDKNPENNQYYSENLNRHLCVDKIVTAINLTDKITILDISNSKEFIRIEVLNPNEPKKIVLSKNEYIYNNHGFIGDGWNDFNKNDIKRILILEGDYTNKQIPSYFEGMMSSGEPIGVGANLYDGVLKSGYSNILNVSDNKQVAEAFRTENFISVQQNQDYIVNWVNNATVKTNLHYSEFDSAKNLITSEKYLGNGTGVIKTSTKAAYIKVHQWDKGEFPINSIVSIEIKKCCYKIHVLTHRKNLFKEWGNY